MLIGILTMLVASTAAASVRFVTPVEGSQTFGRQVVEVATDATKVDRVELYVDGALTGVAREAPYRFGFDFGDSGRGRNLTAKVFSNGYSRREEATIRTASLSVADELRIDLVEVPVRLRSSKRVVASDIRIEENGSRQKVLELRSSRGPAAFVFVVDRSLSMDGGKIAEVRRAMERQLGRLRPEDEASVIFFNHRVDAPRDLRSRGTSAAFAGITPSGGTSLRDALASIASDRRAVAIVISDGADRNSLLDRESAMKQVTRHNLTVYSLLLGSGSAESFLREAAEKSGGLFISASKEETSTALEQIFAEINSRYIAVYQSTNHDRGWRAIRITPNRRDVAVINARKGYHVR